MPYPFAHPVAVLPLVRPLGRFAAPSALAIGSTLPDLWHFVPLVGREDSHSVAGLFWFCLPLGLAAYVTFHLLLKHPLIALLPTTISRRLAGFTSRRLPAAPWYAVSVSLLVGALTHLIWDGLTHSNDHAVHAHNWVQHANTLLGSALLGGWIWHKLRRAPVAAPPAEMSSFARVCTFLALAVVGLVFALRSADLRLVFDLSALRHL
ncbi:MAG TPA: DUF4184 family protein, partial [Burkholderiales bacterium]|nr:DUF4184 family protein [Burkholderiales bacterium]